MSGKSNETLQSEVRDKQRLSRVILNLDMFPEVHVTGLRRSLTCHVLCVPSLALLAD